jgi:hypothetical protein
MIIYVIRRQHEDSNLWRYWTGSSRNWVGTGIYAKHYITRGEAIENLRTINVPGAHVTPILVSDRLASMLLGTSL